MELFGVAWHAIALLFLVSGLRHRPEERQTLITVVDDATKRLLYVQLWPGETTAAVFSGHCEGDDGPRRRVIARRGRGR